MQKIFNLFVLLTDIKIKSPFLMCFGVRSYVHRWVVRIFERFFSWQENRFRANPKVRAGSVAVQMENKPKRRVAAL